MLFEGIIKAKPNRSLVKKQMDVMFALWRREVVKDKPDLCQTELDFYDFSENKNDFMALF